MVLILLGMRYRTRVYMRQIKDLRTELKQAENERIEEKARYMSMIRETDMVQMAQKHNLGLVFSDKPPFVLQTDATDSIPPERRLRRINNTGKEVYKCPNRGIRYAYCFATA